jgi:hypothetical protein
MPHSALPHIWRVPTYPPQVHPFILSLLERFELSFPVGAHIHKLGDYAALLRSGGEAGSNTPAPSLEEPLYLIPSLLPEVRPLKLSSLWPLYCRTLHRTHAQGDHALMRTTCSCLQVKASRSSVGAIDSSSCPRCAPTQGLCSRCP